MKKSNKVLLITGLATVTIGTTGILHTNYMHKADENIATIKAYNHQAQNILDNVFEQNNVKYLPFIYETATLSDNLTFRTIKKDDVIAAFKAKNLTIKNISTGDKIVTGTQITVNENSDVYNVVIYGDINNDGAVNVLDIQKIVRHVVYKGEHELKGTNKIAANVQNTNDNIDVLDARNILKFCIDPVKNKLVDKEPISLKEADTIPPVITLIGNENIELEEGDSYTEEGATAVDNYDGEISIADIQRIIQFKAEGSTQVETVGQVDTSKIGTYTVTYTAMDSNGNKASKTRTIIVKEKELPPLPEVKVESIELALAQDFKTEYQYGEATKLNLTGASIILHKEDGSTDTINVTSGMLSTYDLTTAGEKEITVTYAEKTADMTIKVTVLQPISELIIDNATIDNAQGSGNSYEANSKEDFTLGTVKAGTGTSILQETQLKYEVTVVKTTDDTATAQDLTVKIEKDVNGNILVKGNAAKVGKYSVKMYVEYTNAPKVEKTIEITIEKSNVVGEIILKQIDENEILKLDTPIRRKLIVKNVNQEEIVVTRGNVTVTSANADINIQKKSEDGQYSDAEELDIVDSLQITTDLETAQTIEITVTVNGVTQKFPFEVQDKSIINLEIAEQILNVYTVLPDNETNVIPGVDAATAGNIYTLIQPEFKDQYGKTIKVDASDIISAQVEKDVDAAAQAGKVGILLPKVNAIIEIEGIPMPLPDPVVGIDCICYQGEIPATAGSKINRIGFSIILNDPYQTLKVEELNGKHIVFKWKNKDGDIVTKSLEIKVNYKKLTNLSINTKDNGLNVNSDGNYEVKLGETFTLGTIKVGSGETPVTAQELTTDYGGKTGITISYNENDKGEIVVTGVVTKEGTYQIKPKVGNVIGRGIGIKGITIPTIQDIVLEDFGVPIGGSEIGKDLIVVSDIAAPSESNKYGQPITAKDIKIEPKDPTADYLDIELKKENGAAGNPDDIIRLIEIKAKDSVTEEKEVTLVITLFEGKENEYTKEITVTIYKPIPKSVTISNNVELYDTHIPDVTVQENGLVYTLLPVELFADANKKQKIEPITASMFEERKEQDKVWIVQEDVETYVVIDGEEMPAGELAVLDIKYFKADKTSTSAGGEWVEYIGVAMTATSDDLTYHKSDLNGKTIKLICGEATEATPSATITINYVQNK